MKCDCFGHDTNNVLRDSLSHAVRGGQCVTMWLCVPGTTATTGWDKHADKNVCAVGVLFAPPVDCQEISISGKRI